MKTKEELKQIAIDLADGKIFSDRHIREGDSKSIGTVFMPLILGAFGDMTEEEQKAGKVTFIYEYLDKAGPRSINGMPCFFSCQILNREETELMFELHEKYVALKKEFNDNA